MRGPAAAELFAAEAGGHRFQRVPPTARRGERHSSTVTVSVERPSAAAGGTLGEVTETFCRGSGAGGQNRNKRSTCVVLRHESGLVVREEGERSQGDNRRRARQRLAEELRARAASAAEGARAADLRGQRGTGERSDKVRTYRLREDLALDHRTGRRCRWRDFERGQIRLLR